MAEILDDYDFHKKPRGAPYKYPWEEWMDGQVRKIIKGEDFTTPVTSMQTLLRTRGRAISRSKKVRTAIVDKRNAIVFQYYEVKDE